MHILTETPVGAQHSLLLPRHRRHFPNTKPSMIICAGLHRGSMGGLAEKYLAVDDGCNPGRTALRCRALQSQRFAPEEARWCASDLTLIVVLISNAGLRDSLRTVQGDVARLRTDVLNLILLYKRLLAAIGLALDAIELQEPPDHEAAQINRIRRILADKVRVSCLGHLASSCTDIACSVSALAARTC